jgi:hypothetical protein
MKTTGKHILISHDFRSGSPAAEFDGVRIVSGLGATLEKNSSKIFVVEGCITSAPVALPFPANEMILTWNGASPSGARMLVEFRVRSSDEKWSMWYQLGTWKPEKRLKTAFEDPAYGPLDVDHFKAIRQFDEVIYRFNFQSPEGLQTPILRRVSLCISDTREPREVDISNRQTRAVDLPVPWLSQHDPKCVGDNEMRTAGACAPTSVAMVLRYLGINVLVSELGRRAFDENARIYGNWSYLIAAASEFGPDAYVQRFESLDELEKLLCNGTPAITSVSYEKGDISIKPERASAGHLLVVRGMCDNGDFVCNDPDFLESERGEACVIPRAEFGRAFLSHGAVCLTIK